MRVVHPIGSGRTLFTIPDFRIWAMNGAPSLAIAEQSAAQAQTKPKEVRK